MKKEDLATAFGAAVTVGLFGMVTVAAVFGPDALGGLFDQTGAAWAQAVGTVGAVCAAIWIARREGWERRNKVERLYEHFVSMSRRALAFTHNYAVLGTGHSVEEAAAMLRDAYDFGRTLDVGELETSKALKLVQLRTELARVLSRAEAVPSEMSVVAFSGYMSALKRAVERAADRCEFTL